MTDTAQGLLGTQVTLQLAGQSFAIEEMSVRQTLQLVAHREAIADLDWSDLPALLAQHPTLVLNMLSIVLRIDEQALLDAKNSEVMAAAQVAVSLNKAFFLQAVQSVVVAMQLKAAVQSQVQAAKTAGMVGQTVSASSSAQATAKAMSTPTASANTAAT
jgi:hypothetical protein